MLVTAERETNRVLYPGHGVCLHAVWKNKKPRVPDEDKKIGEVVINETTFWLFTSARFTLSEMDKEKRSEIIEAFIGIYGDGALAIPEEMMREIVKGQVQLAWYDAMGRTPSDRVIQQQVDRLANARALAEGSKEARGPAKKNGAPKPQIKDVITSGLLAGHDTDVIIKAVHEQFSDAHTGPKDIAFYRCKLRKEGLLPKFVRKPK